MASRQRENCCFQSKCQKSKCFVQIECPIEEFIQANKNKNTLSKTTRDLALLKEFLKAKQVDKDVKHRAE
jgi:hypothetical protein